MKKQEKRTGSRISPWYWVPSLYYAEGIPYIVVMMVSVIFYKRMGISNADIALYTSWLYLPWVIKPLWSPIVDLFSTKRSWIVNMQLLIALGLAGVAFTTPLPGFFKLTLVFFWLLAFSSATHDIAADGFYMLGLNRHQQAWFVGIRSTFYRLAMITGQGLLIILAGYIEAHSGLEPAEVTVAAVQSNGNQFTITQIDTSYIEFTGEKKGIIISPDTLKIPLTAITPSQFDALLQFVKSWNQRHGHTPMEKRTLQKGQRPPERSWWSSHISLPLKEFLKKYFGERKADFGLQYRGNVGIISIRPGKKPAPGEEIVIHFGRKSGDKSISLVYGNRFTFTSENFSYPALALIQLDHRLKEPVEAIFEGRAGNIPLSWTITFAGVAVLFLLFFIYHKFVLPRPGSDRPAAEGSKGFIQEFLETFALFFKKKKIGVAIAFLLLYRLGESQLVKLASPFLLDAQEVGGLALTTGQVGFVYGTMGILMLTLGGLLGGFLAARNGLKYWIWWMAIAINLPDAVYIYLSSYQPDNFFIINLCVAIEQFGYGFGFTAYMLFMIYISEGKHKTAHFAITTGFMALGMMIPGMFSGWLQEIIGYQHFFIWVLIATIPGFIVIKFLDIDPEFGKKTKNERKN